MTRIEEDIIKNLYDDLIAKKRFYGGYAKNDEFTKTLQIEILTIQHLMRKLGLSKYIVE